MFIYKYPSFNAEDYNLVVIDNGKEVWVCNYTEVSPTTPPSEPTTPDETEDLSATISGNTNLKVGFSRTYTVNFTDESGNEVDWNDVGFSWNVISDFDSGLIEQTISGNAIKLSVDDENLIGGSFILSVVMDTVTLAQIEVTVADVF